MKEEKNYEFIKSSPDDRYSIYLTKGNYVFLDSEDEEGKLVETPGENILRTTYRELADRILDDLYLYGYEMHSSTSVLPWHFTMIDNFAKMSHEEVEEVLNRSFLQKFDWTFDIYTREDVDVDNLDWEDIIGDEEVRKPRIRKWLSKCTHMQMTAACCIGNAYESLNIAFILAMLMENFEGNDLLIKFDDFADFIEENNLYFDRDDLVNDFETFELYYGIHLKEHGKTVNIELDDYDIVYDPEEIEPEITDDEEEQSPKEENSGNIILYKDKWKSIEAALKKQFSGNTAWVDVDEKFDTDILLTLVLDKSVTRNDLLTQKFNETIELSNSSKLEDITTAFSRMAGLCQVLDFGPAGAWLGMFCEEVLGKYEDAQYWYNKAASFKCGIGMYRVGLLYLNKKVPLPNGVSLKRCFTDALANGVPEAQAYIDIDEKKGAPDFDRVKAVKQSVHIVMELLEKGREFGIIVSDSFANIPEIMDQARPVCFDLLSGLKDEESSQAANPLIQMTWAAYAGIGAVYHWNKDWETLKKKGIYRSLTEERGIYAMDEYIMDSIGMPYDSAEEKSFRNHLINVAYIAIAEAAKYKNEGITDFASGMMAMYDFGMVYEMNRLGMY